MTTVKYHWVKFALAHFDVPVSKSEFYEVQRIFYAAWASILMVQRDVLTQLSVDAAVDVLNGQLDEVKEFFSAEYERSKVNSEVDP